MLVEKKKLNPNRKTAAAKNAAGKNQDHWIATLNIGVQMEAISLQNL